MTPPDPRRSLPPAAAGMSAWLARERFLLFSAGTGLAFLLAGDRLLAGPGQPAWLLGVFAWLFIAILGSALAVVRHADHLAHALGEPYGTLILTLAVTGIEAVAISAAMMHGPDRPALVRDTIFAVIMLLMNGLIGVSLLLGGWRHREQPFNSQGANAYLGVILPLAMMSLVLPDYTRTTAGPTLSFAQESTLALMAIGLYAAFLAIQTGRYRAYFTVAGHAEGAPWEAPAHGAAADGSRTQAAPISDGAPTWWHALLLAVYMVPVVYLAERLGVPLEDVIEHWHVPPEIGGVIIAVLVATPEAIGAVRAAVANQLQRSVNILLGSVLSTIGLTIPAMLVVSHFVGQRLDLGVQNANYVLLLLTLMLSVVTFGSGRTHVLQGMVHLLLFVSYVLLIFQG